MSEILDLTPELPLSTSLVSTRKRRMRSCILPILGALLFASCAGTPTEKDIAALKSEGDSLVTAIEHYAAKHGGEYPVTFAEAGVTPPKARWGGWQYSVTSGGKAQVFIGDYMRDGFTLCKQIGWKDWYLDT